MSDKSPSLVHVPAAGDPPKERTFTLFPNLPHEIQLQVWEGALYNPRVLEIREYIIPCLYPSAAPTHCWTHKGQVFHPMGVSPTTYLYLSGLSQNRFES